MHCAAGMRRDLSFGASAGRRRSTTSRTQPRALASAEVTRASVRRTGEGGEGQRRTIAAVLTKHSDKLKLCCSLNLRGSVEDSHSASMRFHPKLCRSLH